mmetsp:Transcript_126297/g.351897  ORF Transcript_126297/g.351897 Transcript_126297/m.351897 type:complete len:335 (+) Transcript_126297:309-1313(+)
MLPRASKRRLPGGARRLQGRPHGGTAAGGHARGAGRPGRAPGFLPPRLPPRRTRRKSPPHRGADRRARLTRRPGCWQARCARAGRAHEVGHFQHEGRRIGPGRGAREGPRGARAWEARGGAVCPHGRWQGHGQGQGQGQRQRHGWRQKRREGPRRPCRPRGSGRLPRPHAPRGRGGAPKRGRFGSRGEGGQGPRCRAAAGVEEAQGRSPGADDRGRAGRRPRRGGRDSQPGTLLAGARAAPRGSGTPQLWGGGGGPAGSVAALGGGWCTGGAREGTFPRGREARGREQGRRALRVRHRGTECQVLFPLRGRGLPLSSGRLPPGQPRGAGCAQKA